MFNINNYIKEDLRYKFGFFLDYVKICNDSAILDLISKKLKENNEKVICLTSPSFIIADKLLNNKCLVKIKNNIEIHGTLDESCIIFKDVVGKGNSLLACVHELNKFKCYPKKILSILDLNLFHSNSIPYEWLFQIDLSKRI